MKQSNVCPLLLLMGGAVFAVFFGIFIAGSLLTGGPSFQMLMYFAIACAVGVLGFIELKATDDFNETFYGE